MSGYEKGQIYKVVDVGFHLCYIGSTTEKKQTDFWGRPRDKFVQHLILGRSGWLPSIIERDVAMEHPL